MTSRFASLSLAERRRSQEFALLLEGSRPVAGHELESLVALAATLRPAPFAPRPEFRTALRESLVAECSARPTTAVREITPAPPRHRIRTVVVTGVLVGLVGSAGAAAASTHALPGDSLYGLKRSIESVQLKLAHSDLSQGRELLEQADHRLSEAEALAASENARSPETTARIAQALTDMDAAARDGADEMNAAYADSGDTQPLVELDRFATDQSERLDDLATLLGPDLRDQIAPLSEMLRTLQTRLDTLLRGTSASALPAGAADTALVAAGRDSGDGWAVSRLLDQTGLVGAAPGGTASLASGAGGAKASDPTGLGDVVTGVIDGLTSPPATGGGGGGSGGLGNGGAASTPSLPTALPDVSLPAVPLPTVTAPSLPLPLPTAPATSAPKASPPSTSVPLPSVQVTLPCVPVPPLTSC
jgi:Domain of unknown function (DUF5667)